MNTYKSKSCCWAQVDQGSGKMTKIQFLFEMRVDRFMFLSWTSCSLIYQETVHSFFYLTLILRIGLFSPGKPNIKAVWSEPVSHVTFQIISERGSDKNTSLTKRQQQRTLMVRCLSISTALVCGKENVHVFKTRLKTFTLAFR